MTKPARKAPPWSLARVMVEVPTILFDKPFDYLVPPDFDKVLRPGMRVKVQLGTTQTTGIVWQRAALTSPGGSDKTCKPAHLRPIGSIVSPAVWVPANLRRDLEAIAAASGGTVSQLLRLALPDAHPSLTKRPGWKSLLKGVCPPAALDADRVRQMGKTIRADYTGLGPVKGKEAKKRLSTSPTDQASGETAWEVLPGPIRWAQDAAWLIASAVLQGRGALVELPDSRHITILLEQLRAYGLSRFALPTHAEMKRLPSSSPIVGQIAVIDSDDTPTSRTIGFLAAASGAATVVIGTRAVMYAPVPDQSLFLVVDDDAYQNWDGFMPYAGVREVLRLRSHLGKGHYVALSHVRSVTSQELVEKGKMRSVSGSQEARNRLLPCLDWLNSDRLTHLADPALGSRVPHAAVEALRSGLAKGPVLVVPGSSRPFSLFVCAHCGRQARCSLCTGPLAWAGKNRPPVCAWCGAKVLDWSCPHCGSSALRIGRFGMEGTVTQLKALLPGADFIVREKVDPATVPHGKKHFVPQITDEPCVVVAAPSSVPQVTKEDGTVGGYRVIVLLDAWMAGYAQRLDGQSDMLGTWLSLAAQALPASKGGRVLLVGDCPQQMGTAWQSWTPETFIASLLHSRIQAGLPPTVCAATVWGRCTLVRELLSRIGAIDGDLSMLTVSGRGTVPSVMGPLAIRPQETQRRSPTFHGAGDRVRAVVRVPTARAGELAYRLRVVAANIEREGRHGELRFWMFPKDLRER